MIFDKPLLLGKGALDIANMDFFSSHAPILMHVMINCKFQCFA